MSSCVNPTIRPSIHSDDPPGMHGRGQPDSVRLRALLVPRRIAHRRLRAFHEELLAVREAVPVGIRRVRVQADPPGGEAREGVRAQDALTHHDIMGWALKAGPIRRVPQG